MLIRVDAATKKWHAHANSPAAARSSSNRSMTAFEVDMYANVQAKVVIPRSDNEQAGGERMVPWASIGGESETGPSLGALKYGNVTKTTYCS